MGTWRHEMNKLFAGAQGSTMKTYSWKEAFDDAYRAAEAGSPRSQNFVGYCYDIGKGVRRDPKKARFWIQKAAEQGYLEAIFNLGLMNDLGQGMPADPVRAFELYMEAANRGHLQSQANLAIALLDGVGVEQNLKEGIYW